ncbi:hypothetical protein NG800_019075 [Epilithonimonas ginsengisoli]|uniref:Uncharacterized protein n=1 Tax=Epilithonimonas ginsengisoli TaxID=1245592 RepID=A0ABU4JNB2_9FLAO|nr:MULTISPECIES: hypothetical protein [Chryseobacterium group]MBV6881540.1 hypothetical protein [Epilithonimonas sp. FP105]MDW8551028.1 hypothetical protein [Epilithonimonas ginsengisoli]OAH70792.1 hypothetical protein AXA65_12425 [Chryseobacterium sp. FP211-J200]
MVGNIKHIILIDSIDESENVNFNAESFYRDKIRYPAIAQESTITHEYKKAPNSETFFEILKNLSKDYHYLADGLLLHFDIHGDKNKKGFVLESNELIPWSEVINHLRTLNLMLKNKLYLTMTTCFGRYLYLGVEFKLKSPYSCYISSSESVGEIDAYENYGILFNKLFETGNLIASYNEMDNTDNKIFYYKDSEMTFENAFNSLYEKLTKDGSPLKKIALDNAIKHSLEQTGNKLSYEEAEVLQLASLNKLHKIVKENYQF